MPLWDINIIQLNLCFARKRLTTHDPPQIQMKTAMTSRSLPSSWRIHHQLFPRLHIRITLTLVTSFRCWFRFIRLIKGANHAPAAWYTRDMTLWPAIFLLRCSNFKHTGYAAYWLVISGFRRDVDDTGALLGCYAASNGNPLLTFRDSVSVPSSSVKKYKKNPSKKIRRLHREGVGGDNRRDAANGDETAWRKGEVKS
jgi:hypothetical protein